MTYLSDKARSQKRNAKFFIGVFFLCVIIFFWQRIQTVTYPYIEPVVFIINDTKKVILFLPKNISLYFHTRDYYDKHTALLQENIERLENKVAEDEGIIADFQMKDTEQKGGAVATLVAHPLLMDLSTIYSSVILSKGYVDSVEVGDLVYLRGRQPIGMISKVYNKTSLLSLFTDSGNKIDGVINNETVLPLVGDGGGVYVASVPKETLIHVGDTVYYRPNPQMKLGEVSDIKNDQQDVFMKVYIRGNYNPMDANNFFIDK